MFVQTILLSLSALALSLPTSSDSTTPQPESWLIPRLEEHVMSQHTGLPGDNPWGNGRFNSTIDFDAILPTHSATAGNVTVNCKASFLNGTLPAGPVLCTGTAPDDSVQFSMKPYVREGKNSPPELSYVLTLMRVFEVWLKKSAYLFGEVAITANDAANTPSSYLTCLLGIPMDGLRCKIHSYMSVQNDLVIQATSGV